MTQEPFQDNDKSYPQFYIEDIEKLNSDDAKSESIKGFTVFSTAPINVEDNEDDRDKEDWLRKFWLQKYKEIIDNNLSQFNENQETISQENINLRLNEHNDKQIATIAKYLKDNKDCAEITISIHGYSMTWKEVEDRNKNIYNHVKSNYESSQSVFIGYRWSAENPIQDKIPENKQDYIDSIKLLVKWVNTLKSLPISTIGILIVCLSILIANISFVFCEYISFRTIGINDIWINQYTLFYYVLYFTGFLFSLLYSSNITQKILNLANQDRAIDIKNIYKILPNITVFIVTIFEILDILCKVESLNKSLLSNQIIPFLCLVHKELFIAIVSLSNFSINIISIISLGIISSLILLKFSNYFRDRYRASHYGVLDLVELIRKLDKKIQDEGIKEKKIRLNFIAHSMGCFILTQTIRILSDVFDNDAINGNPNNNIGSSFSLGRIVLVAPDISINSIITQRSNFFISSIERCEEVYVFSNEADVVLRFMSTVANYISFPMAERKNGFRLGNISINYLKTVNNDDKAKVGDNSIIDDDKGSKAYGIKNFQTEESYIRELQDGELQIRMSEEFISLSKLSDKSIAKKISFFDLTDYTENGQGVLSFAEQKKSLNYKFFGDYFKLCLAQFISKPRRINTHGGYFEGHFSQELIYGLAFLGFYKFVENRVPYIYKEADFTDEKQDLSVLDALHELCDKKKIQVILDKNFATEQKNHEQENGKKIIQIIKEIKEEFKRLCKIKVFSD